ncbi:EAL domain-containing protein [Oribacterium sp. P6A1]|uniref:EAL domain-containing protein n=1 Tax=Oribacterium sp. P6A1 TaxID=1410612 RepID=UPI001FA7D08A
MVETLEYPVFDHVASAYKRKQTSQFNNLLSLDDFGSGLNTCEIAEFMKPDIIKLDRSLLIGIDSNKEKQANCDHIISAAHNHGVKIVAEGIETKAEFECMKQLGSDFFQGYYLGMPI